MVTQRTTAKFVSHSVTSGSFKERYTMNKLLVIIFFLWGGLAHAGYAVIANNGISASSISKTDLKNVFNGDIQSFSGANVVLAVLDSGPDSEAFFDQVLGTKLQVFERAWLEKALTGKGTAPKKKSSSAEVINFVSSTPGAIGFISDSDTGAASGKVKILTVN